MSEYKIFLGNRFFMISDDKEKCFQSINGIGTQISNIDQVAEHFDFFIKSDILEFYIYTESTDSAFSYLTKANKYIQAAGGVVSNKNNEILLINRLGYWDLPKGKIEKNESTATAARREIEEECGILCTIEDKIIDTYHIYELNGEPIIKKTLWFKARYSGTNPLIPQKEEGIDEVAWISSENINVYIPQMYASVKDVVYASGATFEQKLK